MTELRSPEPILSGSKVNTDRSLRYDKSRCSLWYASWWTCRWRWLSSRRRLHTFIGMKVPRGTQVRFFILISNTSRHFTPLNSSSVILTPTMTLNSKRGSLWPQAIRD